MSFLSTTKIPAVFVTHHTGQRFGLKVEKTLLNSKSEFQHILVLDSQTYGRVLVRVLHRAKPDRLRKCLVQNENRIGRSGVGWRDSADGARRVFLSRINRAHANVCAPLSDQSTCMSATDRVDMIYHNHGLIARKHRS